MFVLEYLDDFVYFQKIKKMQICLVVTDRFTSIREGTMIDSQVVKANRNT